MCDKYHQLLTQLVCTYLTSRLNYLLAYLNGVNFHNFEVAFAT